MNAPLPRNIRLLEKAQKNYITGILELACENLDITDTQRRTAEERYMAVGDWLSKGNAQLSNSQIYTQGSIRIGTAIKPINRSEFDVDLMCHLPQAENLRPEIVKNLVGDRLKAHETYKGMLEPLKRGWRLTYANEFHMDITPCVEDPRHAKDGVLVPDQLLRDWKESNPKGYAEWFEARAKLEPGFLSESIEIRAGLEAMPEQIKFKGTLRRVVQLLKRHRDVWRNKQPASTQDNAPISIIITTLATKAYEQLLTKHYDNAIDLLMDIVEVMPRNIETKYDLGYEVLWVGNPTNEAENFADKWQRHPERQEAFYAWHNRLQHDLNNLAANSGMDELAKSLTQLVDEAPSKAVMVETARRMTANRSASAIKMASTGLITANRAAGLSIPTNTFFGQ